MGWRYYGFAAGGSIGLFLQFFPSFGLSYEDYLHWKYDTNARCLKGVCCGE